MDRGGKKKRLKWALAGAVLLALVALFTVRSLRGPLMPAVAVQRMPLTQRVVVSGRVTPPSEIQIGATLSGTVTEVKVDEGQVVEPGETLLQLEASELGAAVAQAEAAVLGARARLAQLLQVSAPSQAQAVRQAELTLDQARRRMDRLSALTAAGGVSESDLDDARNGLEVAESRLASARAQASATGRGGAEVRAAEAQVAQAEAQLGAAKARRDQATLTSPVKAQVLRRDVEPGDSVSPGRTLLVLARVGATRLSVEPDEKNLAFIERGQKAVASADAFGDRQFAAQVDTIAPSVNPERGTVEVKLLVPEPPDYLRPEMTVSVDIEVASVDAGLALPVRAVQDLNSGKPWVWVLEDGRARRADVRLGLSGKEQVEIADGLREGQVVLLESKGISAGKRVRPDTKGR